LNSQQVSNENKSKHSFLSFIVFYLPKVLNYILNTQIFLKIIYLQCS